MSMGPGFRHHIARRHRHDPRYLHDALHFAGDPSNRPAMLVGCVIWMWSRHHGDENDQLRLYGASIDFPSRNYNDVRHDDAVCRHRTALPRWYAAVCRRASAHEASPANEAAAARARAAGKTERFRCARRRQLVAGSGDQPQISCSGGRARQVGWARRTAPMPSCLPGDGRKFIGAILCIFVIPIENHCRSRSASASVAYLACRRR